MKRVVLAASACAALACAAGTAASAASGNASLSISARARTVCTVDLAGGGSPLLEPGLNEIGRMTELCNAVDGYRLVLNHPRGLVGAVAVVDGRRIPLESAASSTVIVDSTHPGYVERRLGLELGAAASRADLALYAEPKGAVF